jgi:insulysin
MGSEKYPEQNEYSSYIISSGGTYNAFTADNMTVYFLELESNFLKNGIEMLSWFFAKPLLNMKNIESELEIINSEHEKNLLNDHWIIDDLFKHFILPNNKYNKFGTGNLESLKGITKEDIMEFYNTYYTTCNMSVCIIDSKSIDAMIADYVVFFSNIESKIYSKKSDRFKKEKLSLVPKNLIIFKSVTEYNFLNFNLIFKANQYNQTDYQLIYIICWLIGTEYNKSIYFYLKENDIIKDLVCSLDYFFDYEAIINLKFIVNEANLETINTITNTFNNLLNSLIELKEKDFKELYLEYQKINLLNCMYSDNTKDSDYAVEIVENLLKGEPQMALLRQYILPTYNQNIYKRF